MQYPTLYAKENSRHTTDIMRGYNHNLRINDGEFFNMKNLTSDFYPVLAPRPKRGMYATPESPQGMIAKNQLCYVDGTAFVMGSTRIEMGLSVEAHMCPKTMLSMGAFVLIMPDKKWINTLEPDSFGDIEATYTSSAAVTFSLTSITGQAYAEPVISPDEPKDPKNMDYWIDTSDTPHVLKQYSESNGIWTIIATTYVKISSPGIGKQFEQYDGVTISGVESEQLQNLNANMVIFGKGDDYIVVSGLLDKVTSQSTPITVSRQMPYMDHVIESGNRIWGCRYGTARNGETVNEIYASKLGDFKNWNCFMGLSTDSYRASCGTDGPFTGAVAHRGYPLFFKESCFHKVYGNYPANFQVQDTDCRGVQQGCSKSLAIVNDLLLYKSRTGVCAFDGSLPAEISYPLGNVFYSEAVAGALRNKYYISMKDSSGIWNVFVYDTEKNMWHREDNLHASEFCAFQEELYCIDGDRKNIVTMLGSGTKDSSLVSWEAETGDLAMTSPDMKYVTRLIIRVSMDADAEMNLYAMYDSFPEWIHICNIKGTNLRSFSVPVRPRRCDHMKLKMTGHGDCKIYSFTKIIAQGSDIS
jgi:hypothetical protein